MRFLLGILFVILVNFFKILSPQFIREALDLVIRNLRMYPHYKGTALEAQFIQETTYNLMYFAIAMLVAAALMSFFMFMMRQTLIVMSRLIEYDMRKALFAHYEKLSVSFYKSNNTGDLMARISEDVSKVRNYLGPAVMYALNLSALFVFIIYSMLQVSAKLTLASLLPLPFLSIMIYFVSSMIHKQSTVIQEKLSDLTSSAQEVFSGIRVLKSYVQEEATNEFYDQECEDFKSRSLKLVTINAFFFPAMLLMIGASTIITVYVGGLEVANGNITTGNIAEFVIYVSMLTWPVTSIGWIASIIQQAEASMKRINEFQKQEPEIISPVSQPIDFEGSIEFDKVSFTYPENNVTALHDISFKIKPGEKVALVGATGSGKSTMAELLLRMYDTTEGQIRIDGNPIQNLDLYNYRRKVGYIPQDVFLFSDTIWQNISFGSIASEEKIQEFAKKAMIHNEIVDLPQSYDTVVGERGVTLSGGQKQRIAIARTLIKQPDIFIFDDCLSAVDTRTEQSIVNYINEELADKTTIIITHRFFNNLTFDKIIVLDEGRIVEMGTHEELFALNGFYTNLIEKQRMENSNEMP